MKPSNSAIFLSLKQDGMVYAFFQTRIFILPGSGQVKGIRIITVIYKVKQQKAGSEDKD